MRRRVGVLAHSECAPKRGLRRGRLTGKQLRLAERKQPGGKLRIAVATKMSLQADGARGRPDRVVRMAAVKREQRLVDQQLGRYPALAPSAGRETGLRLIECRRG